MISLLLLLLSLNLSAIAVRIGAIALELTGLPADKASFQALSAYAGVGFTTKEAELVISHPQRRKVIRTLIYNGSAGIITTIGTLAGTIISSDSIMASVAAPPFLPWLPINPSQLLLVAMVFLTFTVYSLLRIPRFRRLLDEVIAVWLIREKIVTPEAFEEVIVNADGCGVVQVDASATNPLTGRTLSDANLSEHRITVLALERSNEALTYPPPGTHVEAGDRLSLFGPVEVIRRLCTPPAAIELESSEDERGIDALLPIGQSAPLFTLPDQNGENFSLADNIGSKATILIFYPKNQSFHCSSVLRSFGDYLQDLREMSIDVLAINPASPASHRRFCDVLHTDIRILSDRRKRVCKAYRAMMLFNLIVNRCVYVIDRTGHICYARRGRPPIVEVIGAARRCT